MLVLFDSFKGYDIFLETDTVSGTEKYIVLFDRKRHEYATLGQARSAIALEYTRRMLGGQYKRGKNDNQR